MNSANLRRWITWTMAAVLFLSVLFWLTQRDRLPTHIRIATGREGGQYYEFGGYLERFLEQSHTRIAVTNLTTEGSVDNVMRLLSEDPVDLAILQGGSVDLSKFSDHSKLVILAPLYPDVMHVIVRRDLGVTNIAGLKDRRLIIGGALSGMRHSAQFLLRQYNLQGAIDDADAEYFDALPGDESIEGAIVTSGMRNSDLRNILAEGSYEILPITDAAAMEISDPYFRTFEIPKGLYREQPPVPPAPVKTIATTAFLVAHEDVSPLLVEEVLRMIYEEGLRLNIPSLHSRLEAREWLDLPLHYLARRYFDPQDEIGHMAAVMESLAATKELLFALVAGIYLLWERWRRLKEKEEKAVLSEQKNHLDDLLTRTVEIEARQMGETDEVVLRRMLDDVTRIKLQALEELTHEELRGDRSFLIFLTQCSNLIGKIQAKIVGAQAVKGRQRPLTAVGAAAGVMVFLFGVRRSSGRDSDEECG